MEILGNRLEVWQVAEESVRPLRLAGRERRRRNVECLGQTGGGPSEVRRATPYVKEWVLRST
jgi:hypothetical protein